MAQIPEATQTSAGLKRNAAKNVEKFDEVSWNKIWREQVDSEWKSVKEWEKNWGFLNDFDPRGRPKTPPKLPEREPVFSDTVPDTQGHVYGSRVNTEGGMEMQKMEFMFHSSNRRIRMDSEFVCY
uniref:Uncharacterized protein n=1 Tax=Ciona intestinalis TaxID=7719 RepID=H2XKF6_CIOIN|nr:uncharacterized protein C2orf50-like isoform X2 [Ciona intestinalis]|eukprot:XP_002128533.1 uncharacterized protein C2orf50-like isoform X2 [Ciona intestinalis]